MGKPTKPEMTVEEARELTDQAKTHWGHFWEIMSRVHEAEGWRLLGYVTVEGYAQAEFGISRAAAFRLIKQGNIARALTAAVAPGVSGRDSGVPLVNTAQQARQVERLKPILPEVVEEIHQETTSVPPAERTERARQVLREHLARPPAKPKPGVITERRAPVQQVLNLYPPPRTADDVRLVITRVVEQTAHRLAHCSTTEQLKALAAVAQEAYDLKKPEPVRTGGARRTLRRGPAPAASQGVEADPGHCPNCGSLTGDAGRGTRKCRACGWTGKVA